MPIDNLTRGRRLAIAAVMMGTITGMGLLIVEMPTLINTVGAGKITALGLLAAGGLMVLLHRAGFSAALEQKERSAGIILLLIGLAGGAIALLSHLNHRGGREATAEVVTVLDKQFKERSSKSPAQWKLRVRFREDDKWLNVSEAEWDAVEPGQPYRATLIDGAFGFPVLACPAPCR